MEEEFPGGINCNQFIILFISHNNNSPFIFSLCVELSCLQIHSFTLKWIENLHVNAVFSSSCGVPGASYCCFLSYMLSRCVVFSSSSIVYDAGEGVIKNHLFSCHIFSFYIFEQIYLNSVYWFSLFWIWPENYTHTRTQTQSQTWIFKLNTQSGLVIHSTVTVARVRRGEGRTVSLWLGLKINMTNWPLEIR